MKGRKKMPISNTALLLNCWATPRQMRNAMMMFTTGMSISSTRVARVFPNENSLLRLITALLCETSDDWETGKTYLSMECQTPPST